MKHLLVDLYQDCSHDAAWVKLGPTPGVTSLKHRNKEGKLAFIFGMKHLLVDLYQDCSYDAPGVKTGPARGGGVSQV